MRLLLAVNPCKLAPRSERWENMSLLDRIPEPGSGISAGPSIPGAS